MYFPGITTQVGQAEVLTRLPDSFRRVQSTTWADANKSGEPIDSFLEGPLFDDLGNLYVTDIPFGRVFRIDPAGKWELIVQYDGEPNGMKWLKPGVLLITDYKNGLMSLDVRRGVVEPFLQRRNSESFKGVNDLSFDRQGNLYFTDQGQTGLHDPTGRVYRLRPSGQLDLLLSNVPSPNGLVLSPDEKFLFVAATRGNEVWRAALMTDGTVSKVGRFFVSHGPSGPDGLAMDAKGNLVIANPGLGCVWLLDHLACPIWVWKSAAGRALTNVAFGGVDGRTLYCTESETGSILAIQMPNAGNIVHSGHSAD